jgi:hypothetical protein
MRVQGAIFRDFGKVAWAKDLKSRLFPEKEGIVCRPSVPAKRPCSHGTEFHTVFD